MPYTDQEWAELVRLLRHTTPSPKAKATPSLDGTSDELRRSKRAVYELDRAARDCIDEFPRVARRRSQREIGDHQQA
jgi:hypothetical protein